MDAQWVENNDDQWVDSEVEWEIDSATKDLPTSIYSISPADLQALINVIEIRDLPSTIVGGFLKGTSDLNAGFFKIFSRGSANLQGIIESDLEQFDLQGIINVIFLRNLSASVFPLTLIDLPAYILGGGAVELYALLHGWDTRDLGGVLTSVFGPGDLQASILAISHQNISAYIRGWKGIEITFDLGGYTVGSYISNLQAQINIIQAVNLSAYLTPTGGSINLNAVLIPKTILIRKAVLVALLEHKNLMALINYRCQLSKAIDLSAYVYALMKKDLRANIIGWFGSTTDNIKELGAYINAAIYNVQDCLNSIGFVPERSNDKYTSLRIRFGVKDIYEVFNSIDVIYGTYYGKDLSAYVTGVLTSIDLSAALTPVFDWNYTELPSWVIPKTHEVVINLEKFEEQWRRFVEIMFDHASDTDYHYFYVSGTNKVYRLERNKHWTIWVKSYVPDDTSIIDRKNVRFKYGFNMSNYSTVDEAVRDLIDRVSAYRELNLPASINVLALSKYKDLTAYIETKIKYTWANNLRSFIRVFANSQFDMGASLTVI